MSRYSLGRLIHIIGGHISGISNCNEWKPHTCVFREIMNEISNLSYICLQIRQTSTCVQ